MYERNQSIVLQTIFQDVSKFFIKNKKNRQIWFKLSYTYSSTISFAYFDMFFLKILTIKKFFPGSVTFPLLRTSIAPVYTKIMHYVTIAIINESLEFEIFD